MEKMPVFIKVDKYEDVLDIMNLVREKFGEIKNKFHQLEELKKEEDHKMDAWRNNLEEVEGKMADINHMLFEPEQ